MMLTAPDRPPTRLELACMDLASGKVAYQLPPLNPCGCHRCERIAVDKLVDELARDRRAALAERVAQR